MVDSPQKAVNPRHIAFAREYVKNGGNASKALVKAGYSPKSIRNTAAVKRNKDIQNEIWRLMERSGVKLQDTIMEHGALIRQNDDYTNKNKAIELHYKVIGALSNDRNAVAKAPVGLSMFIDGNVNITEPPSKGRTQRTQPVKQAE